MLMKLVVMPSMGTKADELYKWQVKVQHRMCQAKTKAAFNWYYIPNSVSKVLLLYPFSN